MLKAFGVPIPFQLKLILLPCNVALNPVTSVKGANLVDTSDISYISDCLYLPNIELSCAQGHRMCNNEAAMSSASHRPPLI